MDEPARYKCMTCSHVFTEGDMLNAPNPFEPRETIQGCPACQMVNDMERVCDEPGCDNLVTCGWAQHMPDGTSRYRSTCGQHALWNKEKDNGRPLP